MLLKWLALHNQTFQDIPEHHQYEVTLLMRLRLALGTLTRALPMQGAGLSLSIKDMEEKSHIRPWCD
jgi:hypothetical protein